MKKALLIFSGIIFVIGTILLCYVDWKIYLGVMLLMWANNITINNK